MATAMLCIPLVYGESVVMVPQRTNNDTKASNSLQRQAVPTVWMDPEFD
jgi:hypothetical protein